MRVEIALGGDILWSGDVVQLVIDDLEWVKSVVVMAGPLGLRINVKRKAKEAWIIEDKLTLFLGEPYGMTPMKLW